MKRDLESEIKWWPSRECRGRWVGPSEDIVVHVETDVQVVEPHQRKALRLPAGQWLVDIIWGSIHLICVNNCWLHSTNSSLGENHYIRLVYNVFNMPIFIISTNGQLATTSIQNISLQVDQYININITKSLGPPWLSNKAEFEFAQQRLRLWVLVELARPKAAPSAT